MDVNGYSVRSAERSVGFSARPLDAFSSRRKGPAWSLPRVVLIEKRPLTESERSSMNRAARSVGARRIRRQGRSNWIWHAPDEVARWR